MCVIAVKPIGVDMPTDERIADMWKTNSHGAGFMYALDNAVYIEKGFMTLEEMTNSLEMLKEKVRVNNLTLKELPMVMHFRIATHGGTNRENTHPFPVTSSEKFLKALDLKATMGVAHNGIITTMPREETMSDTQIFIRDILYPLTRLSKKFLDKYETLISTAMGYSKLAFLFNDGKLVIMGDFKETVDKDGLKYSNLYFVPHKAVAYNKSYYSKYDDEYYGEYRDGVWSTKNEANYNFDVYGEFMEKGKEYYRYVDFLIGKVDSDTYIYLGALTGTNPSLWGSFQNKRTLAIVAYKTSSFEAVDEIDKIVEDLKVTKEKQLQITTSDAKEVGITVDAVYVKNKIGGRKNPETNKLTQSADRNRYVKRVWDLFKLVKVEKGSLLSTRDLAIAHYLEPLSDEAYIIKVTSDRWFYSPLYRAYFYLQKDNTYIQIKNDEVNVELDVEKGQIIGHQRGERNSKYTPSESILFKTYYTKNLKVVKNAIVFLPNEVDT